MHQPSTAAMTGLLILATLENAVWSSMMERKNA